MGGGEGEARAPALALHTINCRQVSLSPISIWLRQPLSIKKSYAGAVHREWKNNNLSYQLTPDFDGFLVCGKQKKFEARPKLNVGGSCFWAHMYASTVFLKFLVLVLFYEFL